MLQNEIIYIFIIHNSSPIKQTNRMLAACNMSYMLLTFTFHSRNIHCNIANTYTQTNLFIYIYIDIYIRFSKIAKLNEKRKKLLSHNRNVCLISLPYTRTRIYCDLDLLKHDVSKKESTHHTQYILYTICILQFCIRIHVFFNFHIIKYTHVYALYSILLWEQK